MPYGFVFYVTTERRSVVAFMGKLPIITIKFWLFFENRFNSHRQRRRSDMNNNNSQLIYTEWLVLWYLMIRFRVWHSLLRWRVLKKGERVIHHTTFSFVEEKCHKQLIVNKCFDQAILNDPVSLRASKVTSTIYTHDAYYCSYSLARFQEVK